MIEPLETYNKQAKTVQNSRKKLSNSDQIKNVIKECLCNSFAQSIIKIILTPHLALKIFLVVCVMVTSSLCSYLVVTTVTTFFNFEVTTTSRTVYETPAFFPQITICDINPFTTQNGEDFLREVNKELYPKYDLFNLTQNDNIDFEKKIDLMFNVLLKSIYKMNGITDAEKKKLGFSLEKNLLYCSYNAQPCSLNDFFWKFDPYFGNCFSFNSGYNLTGHNIELKQVSMSGPLYGLQIFFYNNFLESLTNFISYTGGRGLLVRIDNNTYLSNYQQEGIFVAPGLSTRISIDRQFKFNLPRPYSNCEIDAETEEYNSILFKIIHNSAYQYTQPLCFLQCLQYELIKNCNCTDPSILSLFVSKPKCLSKIQNNCLDEVYSNKIYKNNFMQDNCLELCPLECNRTEYTTSTSSIELIPDCSLEFINSKPSLASDFVTKSINLEKAKQSLLIINIFYNSLSYTISTESPQMNLVSLFGNIGGTMGLFLGISVFSIFELIEIIIEIYYIKKSSINKK